MTWIPVGATPLPWALTEVAGVYGSVVSRDPEALRRDIELRGEEHVRAYGGVLVGESIQEADRELIVRAVNEYEALLAVAGAAGMLKLIRVDGPERATWLAGWDVLSDALARLDELRSGEWTILSSAVVQRRQGGDQRPRGPALRTHMALVDASAALTSNMPPRPDKAAPDRCVYCGFRVFTGSIACQPHSDLVELDVGETRG